MMLPNTIQERDIELKALHADIVGGETVSPNGRADSHTGGSDDASLIAHIRSGRYGAVLAKIWAGDWGGYPSQSEGDLALCRRLAFLTCGDAERIDRLFRRSGLMRPKWDERHYADGRTYGQATIARALEGTDEAVEPFPVGSLPRICRMLVEEGAAAIVAPPDFIAVPLLVAAGAAIGNALEIELKPGWREGSNLYAAIVGDPGSKKSPSFRLPLLPLQLIQQVLAERFEKQWEAYEAALAEWEASRRRRR
jgi:hypothetical protein